MKRKILVIPRDEIEIPLTVNSRKEVKAVVPEILGDELFEILKGRGRDVKPERPLEGICWSHSGRDKCTARLHGD
jgi:hypothetical protein